MLLLQVSFYKVVMGYFLLWLYLGIYASNVMSTGKTYYTKSS